ncbi:flavin reductase family protein [Paenarthrobacter sp. YAF11_1]|uniref:flavin reductase family protein n=1 Tax=Paenarthrobacter sp. YAF11_1 TaxID=3233074 RepID=UPI003F983DC1
MLTTYSPDSALLRETFSCFPSGVAALSAEVGGQKEVLVASSFTVGVSMDPPLVMFAVQNSSTTWPLLRQADRIGISVLGNAHASACRQLAAKDRSGRFTGIDVLTTDGGAVLIGGSPVWFECSIHAEYAAGDHTVVLLEIKALYADKAVDPLVFQGSRFRQLEVV